MTIDTIEAVMEMWTYSSNFLRRALIKRYSELTDEGDAPDWMLYLANECGVIELDKKEH